MSTGVQRQISDKSRVRAKAAMPVKVAEPKAPKRLGGVLAKTWFVPSKRGASVFGTIFDMGSIDRAGLVKQGTPATVVGFLSSEMDISKERLVRITGLPRATITRKIASNSHLSSDESERIVGLAKLIGQVETIVKESGERSDFNPARWFAQWISEPAAALGGRKPEVLIDTADGREAISRLLAQMQSGAYA